MNGSVEYKDGGTIVQHPPTALMLRAARTLKQLADTNDTNAILINQLQAREQGVLQSLEINEAKIDRLHAQLQEAIDRNISLDEIIKTLEPVTDITLEEESNGTDQSIRDGESKVSDVGSNNGHLPGGDSDSEGSGTNFFASSSAN